MLLPLKLENREIALKNRMKIWFHIQCRRYITYAEYLGRTKICTREHEVHFAGFIAENFIFMDGKASPQTAAVVRQHLKNVDVPVMAWAARSPGFAIQK